jgi:hypothetical protein
MCAKIQYKLFVVGKKKNLHQTLYFSCFISQPMAFYELIMQKSDLFRKKNDCSINSRLAIYLLFSNGRTGEAK